MTTKEMILTSIDAVVAELMYNERIGSELLPIGAIEMALHKGEITIDEMKERFAETVVEWSISNGDSEIVE